MIDEKYFIDRLATGESIDEIGANIADLMNKAVARYKVTSAENEKKAKRKELVLKLVEDMNALAELEGCNKVYENVTDADIELISKSWVSTIKMCDKLADIVKQPSKDTAKTSEPDSKFMDSVLSLDDEILKKFVEMF